MPPKKGQPTKVAKSDVPMCGVSIESCQLPFWDDTEIQHEQWGDLSGAQAIDASMLYVDQEFASQIEAFGQFITDWKRPSSIFSPFKPVVFRTQLKINPYEFDASTYQPPEEEEESVLESMPQTKEEMIEFYRTMRAFRTAEDAAADANQSVGGSPSKGQGSPGRRHYNAKKRSQTHTPTPHFMRAFNSALMLLSQNQHLIPQGQYAWELIYPQQPGSPLPLYNPTGKYAVKLFFGGNFRKIMIDDRLPTDCFDQSILTVTEQKEIWPALLAKAVLKALGPQHEGILLTNPVWIASCLMCGWMPQQYYPAKEEILAFNVMRIAMLGKLDANREHVILAASLGDSNTAALEAPENEEFYTSAGLPTNQIYHVLDIKQYQNTSLLRLATPNAQWKGTYSYGQPVWTEELEQALGFSPAQDRNRSDIGKKWNDFWISWDTFMHYFTSLVVLRNVQDRRYLCFKQISLPTEQVPDPKVPVKGKGQEASASPDRAGQAKNYVRFAHFNNEEDATSFLVHFTGLNKPKESETYAPNCTVVVHRYDWAAPCQYAFIDSMSIGYGVAQSMSIPLEKGTSVFRITVENLPMECVVSVMCPFEFVLGDEKEVVKDILGVTTLSDAGVYSAHQPNQTTIWFKRQLLVKQETLCNFALSTLPKGADLSQYKSVAAEAPSAAKGKPAAKGPAKSATTTEVNEEELDDTEHEKPIETFATLALIDLDDMSSKKDTVGKITGATLVPNKNGYLLIAYAQTPEAYGKGLWCLACGSSRPFDSFEVRSFEEIATRTGEYVHNDYSSLFRFNFSVAEASTGSIQLSLSETWGIPFEFQILHNDKQIETRSGKKSAFIEHMTFVPQEKGTTSSYAIHCTLDQKYTKVWEEQRRAQVVQQFKTDCADQEAHMIAQQRRIIEMLDKDPEATLPDDDGHRPGSVVMNAPAISFVLSIHSSTGKMEVKEDNSIAEHLSAIKASWSKPKEEHVAPTKGKPAKGQPVQDEAQMRQTKAKESREKFLSNRRGIFVPYVDPATKKTVLRAEDEPNARLAPIAPTEWKTAQAAEDVEDPTLAAPKPQILKIVEDMQAVCNLRKDVRKEVFDAATEVIGQFWSEIRPDKPLGGEAAPADADDKGKKVAKKK